MLFLDRIFNSNKRHWQKRVNTWGRRAILNLAHPEAEYEAVTERQKRAIFPHLRKMLNGDERVILDFGCGPGRFTPDLAALIRGKAVGMDILPDYQRWTPRAPNVRYETIPEGRIPLETGSVDVVWVCLVLGSLRGRQLVRTVRELERVLKSEGLLFLVENTTQAKGSPHWVFRSFEEHRALFPRIRLRHLADYFDVGERISIMAGRKTS